MLQLSTNCLRSLRLTVSRTRTYAVKSSAVDVDEEEVDLEERPTFLDDDVEQVVPVKVNKSRLLPQHRNLLHEHLPYREPQSWIHLSEKYQRKMYGRYGAQSGVNPRICFPTQQDLQKEEVKERIAQPFTLQQMLETVRAQNLEKQELISKREEEIATKLGKLEQWKQELHAKIAKKEADALAAKQRKERIVEEVRRHFGFKVDPREERFKEMLEQKEKEEKRKDKEAKRKAKEDKMMTKLLQKTGEPKQPATEISPEK